MTSSGATADDKVGIMTTLGFQWYAKMVVRVVKYFQYVPYRYWVSYSFKCVYKAGGIPVYSGWLIPWGRHRSREGRHRPKELPSAIHWPQCNSYCLSVVGGNGISCVWRIFDPYILDVFHLGTITFTTFTQYSQWVLNRQCGIFQYQCTWLIYYHTSLARTLLVTRVEIFVYTSTGMHITSVFKFRINAGAAIIFCH